MTRSSRHRVGRIIYGVTAFFLTVLLLRMNWNIWFVSSQTYRNIGADVLPQLTNIKRRLKVGDGDRMQMFFPEGWFFSHIVYGYSWVNVGLTEPSLRQRAIEEVKWTLAQADTPKGRKPFRYDTQVPNGVFYLGWSNRLLGGLLKLQSPKERSLQDIARFQTQSEILAKAYALHPNMTLDAYPGMAWPCDQTVALASLALHDELFGSDYKPLIQRWVRYTKRNLDPKTQLIPHKVDAKTGAIAIAGRSSSQTYLLPFLLELDPAFGMEQYRKFRRQFVTPTWGFLPVREYPIGVAGKGDVDTGPLIFGLSPTSNITTLAAARAYGDRALVDSSLILTETLALPVQWPQQKSYAFGQLLVIDNFLVWGKTVRPWTAVASPVYDDRALPVNRWAWLLSSVVLLGFVWMPLRLRRRSFPRGLWYSPRSR